MKIGIRIRTNTSRINHTETLPNPTSKLGSQLQIQPFVSAEFVAKKFHKSSVHHLFLNSKLFILYLPVFTYRS